MVEENKYNFLRVELANHKVPEMIAVTSSDWVLYGKDDNYPNYLINLFNRSAKHNALLTGKGNYIFGNGLKSKSGVNTAWLEKANEDGDWQRLAKKIILDFEIFNGFYLEIIWNKLGSGFASVKHIPFHHVRASVGKDKYYYSPQMGNTWNAEGVIEYKPFNPNKPRGKQLFAFSAYRAGAEQYPLPDYIGAIASIATDIEIANFHLNNIKNQFWGGKLISLNNGVPQVEGQGDVEKRIKKKFTGSDNAGGVVIEFAPDNTHSATISDLTASDLDKQFIQLRQDVTQEIFTGHKITSPLLFGIKTEGQLGGNTELQTAYGIFKSTYIKIRAAEICEAINYLCGCATGTEGDFEFLPTDVPIEFTEQTLIQVATKDELRKMINLPAIGDNTIGTNKPVQVQPQSDITNPNQPAQQVQQQVNDNIKNLSAKQHQQLLRIIRQYGKGQLTQQQATTLLKTGLGLSDNDINSLLGVDTPTQMRSDKSMNDDEKKLISLFAKYGQPKDNYEVLKKKSVYFHNQSEMIDSEIDCFASETKKGRVLQILSNDSSVQPSEIAKAVDISEDEANTIIAELKDEGLLSDSMNLTVKGENLMNDLPFTTEISVMYSYDVAPGLGATIIETSREFCREMVAMNKLWSATDIADLSVEYGYDIWERRGGFWRHKGTDTITPYCRHIWAQEIVRKKIIN